MLQPTRDLCLIEADTVDDSTDGGILLPEDAREKPSSGTIIAVGPGRMRDNGERPPVIVSVGDRVIFTRSQAVPVEDDGRKLLLVAEASIQGVWN